jgi:hypothetical protein
LPDEKLVMRVIHAAPGFGQAKSKETNAHHNRFAIAGTIFYKWALAVSEQPQIYVSNIAVYPITQCGTQRPGHFNGRYTIRSSDIEQHDITMEPQVDVCAKHFLRSL